MEKYSKGYNFFAKTTGYELLNLGVKLASGTQVLLEHGEELFGGEGSSARTPKIKDNVDVHRVHQIRWFN